MDNVGNENFTWKTQLGLQCQVRKAMLIPASYSLRYFHTGNNSGFHFSHFSVIVQLRNSGGDFPPFFFFPIHSSRSYFHIAQEFFALLVNSLKSALERENGRNILGKGFSLAAFSILGTTVERSRIRSDPG